jgi:hypothetical protein
MNRDELIQKEMAVAEAIFGTESDPDQIPINLDSVEKLDKLCKGWLETRLNDENEPVSWVLVFPTQKDVAIRFIKKEITERQILDLTLPAEHYDAVYLASAITLPEQRGKGYASELLLKAINNMPVSKDALLFAWPWSEDGEALLSKFSTVQGKEIQVPLK